MLWAGRSVWHDRHVGIVEVPGSNPGPSTNFRFQSKVFFILELDWGVNLKLCKAVVAVRKGIAWILTV